MWTWPDLGVAILTLVIPAQRARYRDEFSCLVFLEPTVGGVRSSRSRHKILVWLQSNRTHDFCPLRNLLGIHPRKLLLRAARHIQSLGEQQFAGIGFEQYARDGFLKLERDAFV